VVGGSRILKDLFNLKGEIAVVTGALGKLGPIWIDTLLEAGAKVFALDHPSAQRSEAFKKLQAHYDDRCLQLAFADVTAREAVEDARQKCLNTFGVPSILVNNAGIDQPPGQLDNACCLEDIPIELNLKVFEVNAMGLFLVTQVSARFMPALLPIRGFTIISNAILPFLNRLLMALPKQPW
jgi:NAD(P)-dependent dehydrogenase (short-subunit alcohol dehydrogenase family)